MTRAKTAALTTDDSSSGAVKKPLQARKSATNSVNANTAGIQRKRAALGDVSNVTKSEVIDGKDVKKALSNTKLGLVSKASQNAGIQKISRTNSTRTALIAKDNNKKSTASELKRPASGSGVMGGVQKKRNTTSTSSVQSVKEEDVKSESSTPPKEPVKVEIKEETKTTIKIDRSHGAENKDASLQPDEVAPGVLDLDSEDLDDPLMVAEYVHEIFEYLAVLEVATMPNPDYIEHQDDLEWKMRGILVDWLIEVHTRFHLLPETLFLTINIIDRFLSAKVVQLDRLQLVGVTAMFIASKYEEVLSPHVANFRHVADDGFTEQEILSAERYILAALNYDLSYPNPMNFLRRISKADSYDIQTRTLGKYLMEISLLDHQFMEYRPSHVAAAAMYLARIVLDRSSWVSKASSISL